MRLRHALRLLGLMTLGVGWLPAPGVAEQGAAGRDAAAEIKTVAFSPNGDGVRDVARIRFTLPSASTVSVRLTIDGEHLMQVRLGRLVAGTHVWTWDGRVAGRTMPHGFYGLRLRTSSGVSEGVVMLDQKFEARVVLTTTYGRPRSAVSRIYPRTRVMRDAIGLEALEEANEGGRSVLLVRDDDGSVVLRRNLRKHPTGYAVDGVWRRDPEMWEARDADGRPLPPGLYEATVSGIDHVGNRGTSRPLIIRVSGRRLEWVEETRHVVPDDVDHPGLCGTWFDSNGCPDSIPCGPVLPSALFPGGLTHRSAPCTDYRAAFVPPEALTWNWFPVPDAVRGIEALRVSFSGAPTVADETDEGTLAVHSSTPQPGLPVTSSTGGSTAWVVEPFGAHGSSGDTAWGLPRRLPSAVWSFWTTGDDSFDVASYTVDMRYLAVED